MKGPPQEHPFDRGLQTERTFLAWRRTALAVAVANAAAVKYLFDTLGSWTTLLAVAGFALSASVWVLSARRYRTMHEGLVREGTLATGGRMPTLLAASVLATALTAGILMMMLWRPW